MSKQEQIQKQKSKLKDEQKQKDEEFKIRRDLNLQDKEALELYIRDFHVLPEAFTKLFTKSHLRVKLQEGYEILKKAKKTKAEIRTYLTGAALSAGYKPETIRNWLPSDLKDATKSASGKIGGYKRGFARKKKSELRGPDSISHKGGINGSPMSKGLANTQMQLQKVVNKVADGLFDGSMKEVSLKIKTKDVDIEDCVAKIKRGVKEGKDLELFGENGKYVDLKKGFRLITPS